MESWRENRLVFWVLALPGTLWLSVFFLIPLGLIWLMSFGEKTSLIDIEITGTLDNYLRTTEWVYLQILWKSLWISASKMARPIPGYEKIVSVMSAPLNNAGMDRPTSVTIGMSPLRRACL